MAKRYKEAPWWWYVAVLVISFILGLVVVIKENITLPVWGYIVSLILGTFIAPLVRYFQPLTSSSIRSTSTNRFSEYHFICPLRQWYRHEQLVQDVGRSDAPWKAHRQHVFRGLVSQCHRQRRQPVE